MSILPPVTRDELSANKAGNTVLFACELGGGLGHVSRLLPIAAALHAEGLAPLFAVSNPVDVHPLLSRTPFRCVQAPRVEQGRRWNPDQPQVAGSFADVLALAGLGEDRILRPMIEAWRTLMALARPCLLVCEYSPFFCLAARDRRVVVLGNGFTLPPPHLPEFPPLSGAPPQLATTEMLRSIAAVLEGYGYPIPPSLPSIFEGTRRFVCSLAELDPYLAWRQEPPCGPPVLAEPCSHLPPTLDLFAYLAGESPYSSTIMAALVQSGLSGHIYARRAKPEWPELVKGSALELLPEPPSISTELRQVRIVVHHGGMALTEEAMAAGRPQVVLPIYLEQYLTAKRLSHMQVAGIVPAGATPAEIAQQIRTAVENASMVEAARHASDSIWARHGGGCTALIARTCLALIG